MNQPPDRPPAPGNREQRWRRTEPQLISDLTATLGALIKPGSEVENLDEGPQQRPRYFRVIGTHQSWFVKSVSASSREAEMSAGHIAKDLMQQSVAVVAPLTAEGFPWQEDQILFVYPWQQGRSVPDHPAAQRLLGMAIGRLHAALRNLKPSLAAEIDFRSSSRLDWLLDRNRDLPAFCDRLRNLSVDRVAELIGGWPHHPWEELRHLRHQVIHGDLNIGNMLWLEESREIRFLDFEEATRQCLPTALDLAMVFERSVLTVADEDDHRRDSLLALLDGYAEIEGRGAAMSAASAINAALDWNLLVPLTILAEQGPVDGSWRQAEWEKFQSLAELRRSSTDAIGSWVEEWSGQA